MKADILRDKFLSFFKSKKHKVIESDSLAPKDDPTVLFTPAGMNQFKKEFLGFDSGFKRAATSQRCLRTDDLDKVGHTRGHHTFFEMLGNFSFGDYFKKEAIAWAWEFLTQELKVNPDELWASVYREDEEAYGIWQEYLPHARIVKLGDKENFWPSEAKTKGPNGPCGPCSEIFFDQGRDAGCKKSDCSPACDCGRFLEVWNLVFTQYNRKEDGTLTALPHKNIDTGMGLERLAAVMQSKANNFETDLFVPLTKEIMNAATRSPDMKYVYAVSDHIRAIVFSIYDGVLPSNEARGYIVRKLIRKGAMHLKAMGISKPFLYKLVPVVSEIMKQPYPELDKRREDISQIVLVEEKNFFSVLDSSPRILSEKFADFIKGKYSNQQVGKQAFELYDTHGIPLEVTLDWLKKKNIDIALEGFNEELEKQKARSKSQSAMKGDVFAVKDLVTGVKDTDFTGYDDFEVNSKIIRIIKDGEAVKSVRKGDTAKIILDKSVFYPESGGQVADIGTIVKGKNTFQVLDVQKKAKVIIHSGRVIEGVFKDKDLVSAVIDKERRIAIARNHTATHLLQAALRKVLGPHVKQQGSLVAQERLRFDFTHFKHLDDEQIRRVEELVNSYIMDNSGLRTKQMSQAQAKKTGALAFFGEKYDAKVRVVSIEGVSMEFCGGTHLINTGEVGLFKIIREESAAAGVRRIEAVTGWGAYLKIKEDEAILSEASLLLGVPAQKLAEEISKRLERSKELEKELAAKRQESVSCVLDELLKQAQDINGLKVVFGLIENADMDSLRKSIDTLKEKLDLALLGAKQQGRALLAVGLGPNALNKGLDATALIKQVGVLIGGSGGGRKDFAQGSGSKPENFSLAFQKFMDIIKEPKP